MAQAHEVSVARRVEASVPAVWEVVTDLDVAADRLSQVVQLDRLTAGPYDVGTRWRETRRMMGRSETQEMTVVENDPERRTVTEAEDAGTRYRTEISLTPLDDGRATQLTIRFLAWAVADPSRLQRLALTVVGPLARTLSERTLRTELDDIASAAQAIDRR